MANSAPNKTRSTQDFIEVLDIVEDVVILKGGNACLVIEVKATNFALLSAEEQDVKIYSYASLLNSLSFPIQIIIRSKKINISSYLKLLDEEKQSAKNENLSKQIALYKDFVEELVQINTILDKNFYIVIPYSSLEKGITGAKEQLGQGSSQSMFFVGAKAALKSKAEGVHSQLRRLNLKAETLTRPRLIKLFYEIYNDLGVSYSQMEKLTKPER